MAAILVGGLKCWTKFWKGTTKGSFQQFGWDWLSSFREKDSFKISSPLFSISSLVAILVGSRDHRTQFWKGAIQGLFHQSLVAIGPVVSEEKIFMWISHKSPMLSYVRLWGPSWSKGRTTWLFLEENHPMTLFHQHLVLIEQMVSDKKIFMGISHRVLC